MPSLADLLFLERFASHEKRHEYLRIIRTFLLALFFIFVGAYFMHRVDAVVPVLPAFFLIGSALWLHLLLMEFYFRFRITEIGVSRLWASRIVQSRAIDLVLEWVESVEGKETLLGAGVPGGAIDEFLDVRGRSRSFGVRIVSASAALDFSALVAELARRDEHLAAFLFHSGVGEEIIVQAARTVVRKEELRIGAERWWSRERLERIPVLGRSITYAPTPVLDRFSSSFQTREGGSANDSGESVTLFAKKLGEKRKLLVKSLPSSEKNILAAFCAEHQSGRVPATLSRKRFVTFDGNKLLGQSRTSSDAEDTLITIAQEIAQGDVIVFFHEMDSFMLAAQNSYFDARTIMEHLFAAPHAYVVVTMAGVGNRPGFMEPLYVFDEETD